jgi:hypothetical protein
MLLKIVDDTVAERTISGSGIISAYLHGTLLTGDPLLGGAADIDITFVHEGGEEDREIVRLTNEVHLDICHHPQSKYEQGRVLREFPWEGSTVFQCQILHDPSHFMEFTQANVRGLFDRADNVNARAQPWLEEARWIWMQFNNQTEDSDIGNVKVYLTALEKAANAVACLSGSPLTERRFLLEFPARVEAVGQPGLAVGLIGLLGGNAIGENDMRAWLPSWETAFDAAGERVGGGAALHPARKQYYLGAMEALLDGENPQAAMWPLLRTWTDAVVLLGDSDEHLQAWVAACDQLDLLGGHFEQKLAGLDAYLDSVEDLFDRWRGERGL